jgi:hypothetical protein
MPKLIPEKYALQAIRIEVPFDQDGAMSSTLPPSDEVEEMLKHPKAVLTEFPVVYAAVGETAINDQTKTIPVHTSFEVKTNSNGMIEVVYVDGTARIGRTVEITIQTIENSLATCALNLYENSLAGMQDYVAAPATETRKSVTASLPVFKMNRIKTSITGSPGSWLSMGSLIKDEDGKFSPEKQMNPQTGVTRVSSFMRILPPKEN